MLTCVLYAHRDTLRYTDRHIHTTHVLHAHIHFVTLPEPPSAHLPHGALKAWEVESIWVDRLDGSCQGAGRAWDQAGSPGTGVAMWAATQRQGYEWKRPCSCPLATLVRPAFMAVPSQALRARFPGLPELKPCQPAFQPFCLPPTLR